MEKRKVISIATGCYNEVENIRIFYDRCRAALSRHPEYDYEFVVADNLSSDGTREVLRRIAAADHKFRVIMNSNNFGHIRSPYNALLRTSGDLVLYICSDLQEPPEMLDEFLEKYRQGYKVICGVKPRSKENPLMFAVRRFYYWLLARFSDTDQVHNFTGFGLYDRSFIEALRRYHDPYPYFRGMVGEIGMPRAEVPFVQEKRHFGKTKNNFFTLYDMAMNGFVNHTKFPLRLAGFSGFVLAFFSFITAAGYLAAKLIWWNSFELGMAPLMIGLFFFAAVQLIFIGVLGEYLGAVWTQVKNRPLVIEEETLNFDDSPAPDGECGERKR